ncbi:hypothetical protein, partial [Pseudomonas sp. GW704-F2]|uniref:hypothetical protein n=1 Tax=Pseudomonas sp. GW704-F2 TaxID=2070577 RepID=UPI001C4773B0
MAHWYFVTADGKTGTGATSALRFYRDEGLPVGQFSRRYHKAIIRTGDNSFVLCDGELCSGLRDPITGAKIEKDESSSIA